MFQAPMLARSARLGSILLVLVSAAACGAGLLSAAPKLKPEDLAQRIEQIDAKTPGALGAYAKHLGGGQVFGHGGEREWYIASMVKVPLAIAVLQAVERGELALDEPIELKESDFVDGSGDLLFHKAGERFSVAALIKKSLEDSDSTATDMLMRRLGVEHFNEHVEKSVAPGLSPLTTILQVRYDAFHELHPSASKLTNLDYVEIRSAGEHEDRVEVFRRKLNLMPDDLQAESLAEAFERYYQRGVNTASLDSLATMLERLVRGELLNKENTRLLLGHMERITTGDKRLKAGLPNNIPFAQKTGTQIDRACNMGVVHPRELTKAVALVVCSEGHGHLEHAEKAFAQVAEALGQAGWF